MSLLRLYPLLSFAIVLLAIVSGRVKPPAAVGKPYEKE